MIETLHTLSRHYNGDPSADRDKFIGGSDAGTILGLNPYKSAYTLWLEKTGQIEVPDISDQEQVWWGNYDEEGVAQRFTIKSGIKVHRSNQTFYLKEYPFIAAHVDRLVVGDHSGLECKTTSAWNKTEFDEGDIPPYHYAQCQHYMLVYGASHWYYAVKRNNNQFYFMDIQRDDDFIAKLLAAEIAFWKCIQDRVPPTVDGSESTSNAINRRYADGKDTSIAISDDIMDKLNDISQCDDMIAEYTKLRNEKVNAVKLWMGTNERAEGKGYILNWKAPKPSMTIDNKALKKDMPEVYEKYAKPRAVSRRFTYKVINDE